MMMFFLKLLFLPSLFFLPSFFPLLLLLGASWSSQTKTRTYYNEVQKIVASKQIHKNNIIFKAEKRKPKIFSSPYVTVLLQNINYAVLRSQHLSSAMQDAVTVVHPQQKSGITQTRFKKHGSKAGLNIVMSYPGNSKHSDMSASERLKKRTQRTKKGEVIFIRPKHSLKAWFDIRTGKTVNQRLYETQGFSKTLCKRLIDACEETAAKNKSRQKDCTGFPNILCLDDGAVNSEGWCTRRHTFHPTTDLSVDVLQNEKVKAEVNAELKKLIVQASIIYKTRKNRITVDDAFVVKYSCNASDGQKELGEHMDGSEFTFNIQLNSPTEYTGGGTLLGEPFSPCNNKVRLDQGRMLCHAGRQRHSGIRIKSGVRYILVVFLKVKDTQIAEGCGCCNVQ